MRMADYSPEKAGVGGSIPSLATRFSTTYPSPLRSKVRFNRTCNGPQIGPQRKFAGAGVCLFNSFAGPRAAPECPGGGRDIGRPIPPAQIPTGGITA
jgi:hypothetical protein